MQVVHTTIGVTDGANFYRFCLCECKWRIWVCQRAVNYWRSFLKAFILNVVFYYFFFCYFNTVCLTCLFYAVNGRRSDVRSYGLILISYNSRVSGSNLFTKCTLDRSALSEVYTTALPHRSERFACTSRFTTIEYRCHSKVQTHGMCNLTTYISVHNV